MNYMIPVIAVLLIMSAYGMLVFTFIRHSRLHFVLHKSKQDLANTRFRNFLSGVSQNNTKHKESVFDMHGRVCNAEKGWLLQLVSKYGAENLVFMYPASNLRSVLGFIHYTSSSDEHVMAPFVLENDEITRAGDYKVRLRSIYERYSNERLYTSSLESLVHDGVVHMLFRVGSIPEIEATRRRYLDSKTVMPVLMPTDNQIQAVVGPELVDSIKTLLLQSVVDSAQWNSLHKPDQEKNASVFNSVVSLYGFGYVSHAEAVQKLEKIHDVANEIQTRIDSGSSVEGLVTAILNETSYHTHEE